MAYSATIIVPLLNQEDAWLEQCVRSATTQTVPCQVLVVTSLKTKRSNLELLSEMRQIYPDLSIFECGRGGFAAALNIGIRQSSTSRIGFLLSDDWLDRTAVKTCLMHSEDIVCTGATVFAADGMTQIPAASKVCKMEVFKAMPTLERKANYLEHFFLFQKAKLLEVGGVDESLGDTPGVDDFDLIWVLLEHDASVVCVGKSLYCYRDHDGERLTTRSPAEMITTMRKILAKHKVTGDHQEQLLAAHARFFGNPIYKVLSRSPVTPGKHASSF